MSDFPALSVTFTVEGDTFKEPTVDEPVKLEDKNDKVTITELNMVDGSFTETSVKYTFKVTAKDNATVGTGKIAVTADASVFTGGKDYTGELDYTIEGEPGEFTGWTWDAADEGYTTDGTIDEAGATSKDGNVNFTKDMKTKKDGYIQIPSRNVPTANDWATAEKIVYFTVPKGATKITVNLRTGSTTNGSNITVVSKSDLTKPVFQKNYSNMEKYEDCEITFTALSADTVFYIFNNKESKGEFVAGDTGGLNVKKISVK